MCSRRTTAVLLACLVLVGAADTAAARFSVTPTTVDIERQRGKTASGAFDVDLADERGDFVVEVQDVVQQPEGTVAFQPATKSPFSASSWMTISPRRFSGEPNRAQPIQYTVRVPDKAEPGDHVTAITVKRLPRESGATATTVQAIAVRFTVRVFGKRRPSAEIVSVDAPGISGGSPVEATAEIRNTGNVALDFDRANEGNLAFVQGEESEAELQFDGQLFPGQTRDFDLAWDDVPVFGQFRAVASLDVGKDVLTESKSIFQIPWREIGALVLVALAAIVLTLGRRSGRF
jgi:hypothetical protein